MSLSDTIHIIHMVRSRQYGVWRPLLTAYALRSTLRVEQDGV
jgi:hypothetical protein